MIELLHPGLLGLSALALPLIALYLLKARRQRHEVTALWLWEEVRKDLEARVPLRKLRRDWLLWLQLLILTLLVMAAASPFRRSIVGPSGNVAVVVDASASLLAGDLPDRMARTLNQLVDGLGSGDRMALVRAASQPELLVPLTGSRQELRAALDQARPAALPTNLTPAVELAASLVGDEGAVVVVTDSAASVPTLGPDHRLRILRLDQDRPEADNVGLVSLGVRASDSSDRDHQVFVRLVNASGSAARGHLILNRDGQVRDAVLLELDAGAEAGHTFRLTLESNPPLGTVVEVVWKHEAPQNGNALTTDDRALWILQPPTTRRYRVRGPVDSYLLRALSAIAAADSGWRAANSDEDAELEIVAQETPTNLGPPLLWIDPREGRQNPSQPATNQGTAVQGAAVQGAAVLSWEKTHPALRFIDLRSVHLGNIQRYIRPLGARVLAESSVGPLILEGQFLEGQVRERRYLMWAFDPMQTDLPLRVAYPLLLRHALEYLVPSEAFLGGGKPTGETISIPWSTNPTPDPASKLTLISPSRIAQTLAPSAGQLLLPALEEVGVWTLEGSEAPQRFAVSLLNAEESNLRPRREAAPQAAEPPPSADYQDLRVRQSLRGLWRPLLLLALVLLVLETFAFHRRWRW